MVTIGVGKPFIPIWQNRCRDYSYQKKGETHKQCLCNEFVHGEAIVIHVPFIREAEESVSRTRRGKLFPCPSLHCGNELSL